MTAGTKSKIKTKTPTAAEQVEIAVARMNEARRALNQGIMAGSPTGDLRASVDEAVQSFYAAKQVAEDERREQEEAARHAAIERAQPAVARLVSEALEPIKVRLSEGFSVEYPELPSLPEEAAVKVAWAGEEVESAQADVESAQDRVHGLHARIEGLQSERDELIARRVQGEKRDDDAAHLALIDADTLALGPLVSQAEGEAAAANTRLIEAQRRLEAARKGWIYKTQRARAGFYAELAQRIETKLGDAFEEMNKGADSHTGHQPMFLDDRVRTVAGQRVL